MKKIIFAIALIFLIPIKIFASTNLSSAIWNLPYSFTDINGTHTYTDVITGGGNFAGNPTITFFNSTDKTQRFSTTTYYTIGEWPAPLYLKYATTNGTTTIANSTIGTTNHTEYFIDQVHYFCTNTTYTSCNFLSSVASDYNINNTNFYSSRNVVDDFGVNLYTSTSTYQDTKTRFLFVTPIDKGILPSGITQTLGADVYINNEDWEEGITTQIGIQQKTLPTPTTCWFLCSDNEQPLALSYNMEQHWLSGLTDGDPDNNDEFVTSTTTPILPDGDYIMTIDIQKPTILSYFGLGNRLLSSQTKFTVGTSTAQDILYDQNNSEINSGFNLSTGSASTTCAIFSFNLLGCLTAILIPDTQYIASSTAQLYANIKTHFPLGYITEFIDIMSATTTESIPIFSATVPEGIVGAGSTITLDLNNKLDYILNSTSSRYRSGSATSTESFFVITNRYWEYLIYIMAGLYIARRILGAKLIPHKIK